MGAIADVAEEFKNASPGGKTLMIIAIIAVAGAGIYIYKTRQSSSSGAGTLVPVDSGSSDSGSSDTGTTSSTTPVSTTTSTGTTSSTGSTSTTSSTGTTSTGTTITPASTPVLKNLVSVVTGGEFATTPGGTNNGGSNLAALNRGTQVSLLSNTPSLFNNTKYYLVETSNGAKGFVRGTTIGKS